MKIWLRQRYRFISIAWLKKVLIQSTLKGRLCNYTAVDKEEYQRFIVNREAIRGTGKTVDELVVMFIGKEANEKSLEEVNKMI